MHPRAVLFYHYIILDPSLHRETACISWFTVKYILRFASSSNKLRFMISFMNIIDFLTIMPFYLVLILDTAMMELGNVKQAARVLRVFKLARRSSGPRTLAIALKGSLTEMSLLLVYVSVGVFLFSALGYTTEESHTECSRNASHCPSGGREMPCPQWVMETFTLKPLGKCIAASVLCFGILAIMLPLQLIIKTFGAIYNNQHELEIIAKQEIELSVKCRG